MKRSDILLYGVLLAIGVSAIAGPTWVVLRTSTFEYRVARLQGIAEASCNCARRARAADAKSHCWDTFRSAAQSKVHDKTGTACFPLSTRYHCESDGEREICFGRDYRIVGSDNEGDFCSEKEAMAAEDLFYRLSDNASEGIARGIKGMERFSRQLAGGNPLQPVAQAQGCVGMSHSS